MMQAAPCADTQSPTASTSGGEHPTGSISGGQHPTGNMQCFEIGVEAAELINTDPAVHYAKFQNFIRGEEPGVDLFLGLQPVHIMANPEVIHSYEMLLRGIGSSTHAAPYGVFMNWTIMEEQTFIRMEMKVAHEAQQLVGPKISMNCSPLALSHPFTSELNANMGRLVLEITGWDDTMKAKLAAMPDVEVWLDDVPPDDWKHIPSILSDSRNVTCIKIGYMDSCIVMGKITPTKIEGEPNHGMAKTLQGIGAERKASIQEQFGTLINYLAKRSGVHIVMEVSCDLHDFIDLGYLKPEDRTDFIMCQGMKHHAMLRRIACDYKSYRQSQVGGSDGRRTPSSEIIVSRLTQIFMVMLGVLVVLWRYVYPVAGPMKQ